MKYVLTAVAGLAITAGASAGSGAGWTWTLNDTAGGSGVNTGSGLTIVGGDAGAAGFTVFQTVAMFDQAIDFTALYTSPDSGDFDQAFYFVGDPNNGTTFAQNDTNNGVSQNLSFNVLAGQTFGFGVLTLDGAFGAGTLNVNNISDKIPTPGALGLFGVAGMLAARRRRA